VSGKSDERRKVLVVIVKAAHVAVPNKTIAVDRRLAKCNEVMMVMQQTTGLMLERCDDVTCMQVFSKNRKNVFFYVVGLQVRVLVL
jgi:hypothetical protein